MQQPDEHQWVVRARAGDREAFAALADSYWLRIYRWLLGLCRHSQTAEDLTQEVFLKAWVALGTFEPGGSFQAWLFKIARNGLIDSHRGPRAAPARPLPDSLPAREPGPVAAALTQECHTLVQQACARLPVPFRAVFLLRTQEGLSFAEIAQVMGVAEETVRWRLFKARQALLHELGPYLDQPPP